MNKILKVLVEPQHDGKIKVTTLGRDQNGSFFVLALPPCDRKDIPARLLDVAESFDVLDRPTSPTAGA